MKILFKIHLKFNSLTQIFTFFLMVKNITFFHISETVEKSERWKLNRRKVWTILFSFHFTLLIYIFENTPRSNPNRVCVFNVSLFCVFKQIKRWKKFLYFAFPKENFADITFQKFVKNQNYCSACSAIFNVN